MLCPVLDDLTESEVIVHSIVVELLLLDLVLFLFEAIVDPVEDVKHLDGALDQLDVQWVEWPARYDVDSDQILEEDDILVKQAL